MIFIKDEIVPHLKAMFSNMRDSIRLLYFTQEIECQFCRETRTLLEELISLDHRLQLEVYNFVLDKEKVDQYKIDKIPALAIVGKKDYGLRFYGVPAGYEFTSLVEACVLASTGESGLLPESKMLLKQLAKPLHIKVFVTLTCPYCPQAVQMAQRLAVERSDLIISEMIESAEFPHLAAKYSVMAVPKIVVNETLIFEGVLPEKEFIEKIVSVY